MTGYIFSLSFLIILLLIIRGLFRKSISPRVMYTLWLVVVVRMIIPFALVEINLPWPEIRHESESVQTEAEETESFLPESSYTDPVYPPIEVKPTAPSTSVVMPSAPVTPIVPVNSETEPINEGEIPEEEPPTASPIDWQRIARLVWLIGSGITAFAFIISGTIFHCRLRADRKLLRTIHRTKVYLSESAGAPCLAGLIPAIYVTPEALSEKNQSMILIHEYTHLRHGDHIWSIVRVLALIAHWWNPLVWAAAFVSKQDGELACDDAIAARLDDKQRLAYAHILLDAVPQNHRYATGLGSAPLKERILMLVQKRKNRWICLILAIILALAAVVCSFLGKPRPTVENIFSQNGFTILSQEEKLVELTFPADCLPEYEDIPSAGSKVVSLNSLPVFSEGSTTITAESICRSGNGKSIVIGLLTRYDPDEEGSLISLYRVVNDAGKVRYSTGGALPHSLQDESGEFRNAFDGLEYGYPDDGIIRVLVEIESYRQLNGEVVITLPLNELTYQRGSEVNVYADELRTPPSQKNEEGNSAQSLPRPEISLTEIDTLPRPVEHARLQASPVGGNPTFISFDEGMEFFVRRYKNIDGQPDYYRGELILPENFTDGNIIFMSSGAGSGELFITVEVIQNGNREYLTYYFFGTELQEVYLLNETDRNHLRDQMSYLPIRRDIYLCDDVYRSEQTLTYGSALLHLPIALTEYKVTDCQILRCADHCDPTAVLSRAVWGYAPAWPIDQYEEFTTADGWNYDTRRYINEVPEDIREQMRQSGAPEEVLYPNNYLYLLSIDDNHYAYLCLEPKGDLPGGDAEADLHSINEIVKAAKIKLILSDEAAADTFYGGVVGYIASRTAGMIEIYTEIDGDLITGVPWEIVEDFLANDRTDPTWKAGWMNVHFYTGNIGDFQWVIACSGTAMGSGTMNTATSTDSGKTWTVEKSHRFTGAVTGAIFISEKVGYVSHQYFEDNGPSISQTTDGGKTWKRLELTVPERLQNYKMVPGVPFKEQDTWLYPIVLHTDRGAEDETYLLSEDGLNWHWEAWTNRPLQQTSYFVDIPLDEEKREYLSNAATYGISTGYAPSGEIWAGEDGVRWEVIGIGSHFKRGGVYSDYRTYRVESKDGYIVSVEEAQTFTKALVKANGTPYTGPRDGLYTCKSYNLGNGLLHRSVYISGREIVVSTSLDGTDAGGTYRGEINTFDPKTGLLTATVTSRTVSNDGEITVSQPLRFSGYLLEYGGFVHFLCETSQTRTLSPDDPLPLTFLPNTDGAQDAPVVPLESIFGGSWAGAEGNPIRHLTLDPQTSAITLEIDGTLYTGICTVHPMTREITASLPFPLTFSLSWHNDSTAGEALFFTLISCDRLDLPSQTLSFTRPQTAVLLDPILLGRWVHEFTAESGEKGFYSLVLDTENNQMQLDCGWYESEYDNRYTGSYTYESETNRIIAHLQDTTADVTDPDRMVRANPKMTLIFTLSRWSAGPDATMQFSVSYCSVERYNHWVNNPLLFSRREESTSQPASVSVRTLDQLKDCADRGFISQGMYDFYWNLLSGQSDIPEYRSLKITDVTITFTIPLTDYRTDFSFTVEESDLAALPVGKHQRIVYDIREPTMVDPAAPEKVNPFADVIEVRKLHSFFSSSLIWNTPAYGEGVNYPGVHNYICNHHGENSLIDEQFYREIALEEFGITNADTVIPEEMTRPGNLLEAGALGGFVLAYDVLSVTSGSGTTGNSGMTWGTGTTGIIQITIQFYADCNSLLPSHKVVYRFSDDGRWLGYQILNQGNYEPYGLRYAFDDDPIVKTYHAASEAASWFRIASLLEQPAEGATVDTANPVIRDGMHYFPVQRFDSYNAFTDYLLTLFSRDMLDRLTENNHTYINHNGELYAAFGLRGTNPRMGKETYSVKKISDTRYDLIVTVEVYDNHLENIAEYEEFIFPYEYLSGKWVFTDFPEIR